MSRLKFHEENTTIWTQNQHKNKILPSSPCHHISERGHSSNSPVSIGHSSHETSSVAFPSEVFRNGEPFPYKTHQVQLQTIVQLGVSSLRPAHINHLSVIVLFTIFSFFRIIARFQCVSSKTSPKPKPLGPWKVRPQEQRRLNNINNLPKPLGPW
jgi:hypothetical protein